MSSNALLLDFAAPTSKGSPNSQFHAAFDHFASFGSGAPTSFDLLAPHPDQFEFELDQSADLGALSALDITPFTTAVNGGHPAFYSSDFRGPGSTFTTSSESMSGYDYDYEFDTSSYYSSARDSSSAYMPTIPSQPQLQEQPRHQAQQQHSHQHRASEVDLDLARLGLAPITPPSIPLIPAVQTSRHREQISSMNLATLELDSGDDFYPSAMVPVPHLLTKREEHRESIHDTPGKRAAVSVSATSSDSTASNAPVKKYTCSQCPRSFARAFNLKTHMGTHDPHRVKTFACRHQGCGRSFSRKHDLGRHLTSIHAGTGDTAVGIASSGHRPVQHSGAGPAAKLARERVWCDGCGRGWVKGMREACECEGDVRG